MSIESYSYEPPADVAPLSHQIPLKTEDLVEDFDVMDEADGQDLQQMEDELKEQFFHAYNCGCGACMGQFIDRKRELYDKTRVPDEDTGLLVHSLLHLFIKHNNGTL